jgi:hypothetical protein
MLPALLSLCLLAGFHMQGPFSGAIIASLIYEIVFRPDYDAYIDGDGETIQELGNQDDIITPSMKAV